MLPTGRPNGDNLSTRIALLALAVAAAATVPGTARAQTGPCGFGNAKNSCLTENSNGVSDAAETDDRFGAALALGDFNGDGRLEVAVGAPGEVAIGGGAGAGAVWIFRNAGASYIQTPAAEIRESSLAGQTAAPGESFGRALAAGDFNGDGFDDLAIGAPNEALTGVPGGACGIDNSCADGGKVFVIYGSPTGLDLTQVQVLDPLLAFGAASLSETINFGVSLAAGAIIGSQEFDDLAVGAPGITNVLAGAGAVAVFEGSAGSNLQHSRNALKALFQEAGERFGLVLEVGQFDFNSPLDLAIGSPFSNGNESDSGRVAFHYLPDGQIETLLGHISFGETEKANDRLGNGVAGGDFDGDGFLDLAVGVPLRDESLLGANDSGWIFTTYGAASGLPLATSATFDEHFWASTPDDTDLLGATLESADLDGDGFDDLLAAAPREGGTDTGFIYLAWGSVTGLVADAARGKLFSQAFLGGTNDADDLFAQAMATGDINGDGIPEIVLGVPDKNVSGISNAGMVYITHAFDPLWIFADGFESAGTANWSLSQP